MNNYTLSKIKKIALHIFLIATLCLSLCALTGCSKGFMFTQPGEVNKMQRVAYLAQVREFSEKVDSVLSGFQNDMKENNTEGMNAKIKTLDEVIDDFSKLEAPSDCSEIQLSYSKGLKDLNTAFKQYYESYNDFNNQKITKNDLSQKISNIQSTYDNGFNEIKKADELIAQKDN